MDKKIEFEKSREIMDRYQTIAVVGLSRHPEKPSHYVPRFLQEQGYTLMGVNPFANWKFLGVKVYDRLLDIPDQVEIVQIFRPSEDVLRLSMRPLPLEQRSSGCRKESFTVGLHEKRNRPGLLSLWIYA